MSRRVRKAFRPTRSCPHRWCRRLHRVFGFLGTLLIFASAVQDPAALAATALIAVLAGIALATSKIGGVNNRVAHATSGADGSPNTEVDVDRLWARVAVGVDIYFVVAMSSSMIAIGRMGSAAFKNNGQGIPADLGYVMIFSVATVVLRQYAHWRATRPRPRRKVRARVLSPAVSKSS